MKNNYIFLFSATMLFGLSALAETRAFFVKPDSSKGCVAIINKQSEVAISHLRSVVDLIRETERFVFVFASDESEVRNAKACISIVNNDEDPAITVSPEIGRATINVAAINPNNISRVQKEFLRAFAFSFGAGASQFQGNIMSACDFEEIDTAELFLPFDTVQTIQRVAEKRGLKPEIIADYYTACHEGWAPSPETIEEKKIWDEAHEIPTEPIRIKFNKK